MKRNVAVIGHSYRIFKSWVTENGNPEMNYVFVNREENARGLIFEDIEYLDDIYELNNWMDLHLFCNSRLKIISYKNL